MIWAAIFMSLIIGGLLGYILAIAILKHESCGFLHIVGLDNKTTFFLELNREDADNIDRWKGYVTLKILHKLD
jgi:hypothetical protein